jgi:hypothetical protein
MLCSKPSEARIENIAQPVSFMILLWKIYRESELNLAQKLPDVLFALYEKQRRVIEES